MIKLYNFDELKPEEILNRDIRAEKNVEDVVDGGGPEGWSGRLISSPAPRRPRRAKRVRRSAKPHRKQR